MYQPFAKPLDELPSPLPVPTLRGRTFDATLRPPGSKSLTNRALLVGALARGRSVLRRPLLDADDTRRMIAALGTLGAGIAADPNGDLAIDGVGGQWRVAGPEARLDLGNAGTATRFLTAAALLSPRPVVIDGDARMRERPIGELADALRQLGATVEFLGSAGCPPIRITPGPAPATARTIDMASSQSSQFISALLLLGPFLPGGMTLRLVGRITSASYVAMTIGLLQHLGAEVRSTGDFRVVRTGPPASAGEEGRPGLDGFEYTVEPDASGATYFWAAGAMVPRGACTVLGLDDSSLQGDAGFPGLLARMGVVVRRTGSDGDPGIQTRAPAKLGPVLADMANMPDAAVTLASVACFAGGTSILRGLGTLRVKESDRIAAMQTELSKIGVQVQTPVAGDDEAVTIAPPKGGVDCSPSCPPVEFETYNDHRMAMSLALIGLRRPNVFIRNPRCVAKTYPTFWQDFARLYE